VKNIVLYTLVLIILLAGCAGQSTTSNVVLGQESNLAPNQSVSVIGEPLKIKFIEVVSDSRCPTGVQCIWAGEVSCLVEITFNNSKIEKTITQQGSSLAKTDFNGYQITANVQPYPKAGQSIDKEDYRLQLKIEK
jgi:hypothetical protein